MINQYEVINILGDGNCQFRAIAQFLNIEYNDIRSNVIIEFENSKEEYKDFCEWNYESYVYLMSCDGAWGDNLTLKAISKIYQINIIIFSETCKTIMEMINKKNKTQNTVYLLYINEHYDLIQIKDCEMHIMESLYRTHQLYNESELNILLMDFYQNDFLSEENILFYFKYTDMEFSKKCNIFLNWLKTAQTEE
jgi:hypothetical protein